MPNLFTTSSDDNGTKIKVIHLEKLDNFVVQFFFDLESFKGQKIGLKFMFDECLEEDTRHKLGLPSVNDMALDEG